MARVHAPIPALLKTYELMDKIGEEHLYKTNRAAVDAYYLEKGAEEPSPILPPAVDSSGLPATA
jgi:hypothetical protein